MNKLMEQWENGLHADVVDSSCLESYFFEVTEQDNKWYGLRGVVLTEHQLANGDTYYVVEEESASELVHQQALPQTISNALLYHYEAGSFTTVGVFYDEEDAYGLLMRDYQHPGMDEPLPNLIENQVQQIEFLRAMDFAMLERQHEGVDYDDY